MQLVSSATGGSVACCCICNHKVHVDRGHHLTQPATLTLQLISRLVAVTLGSHSFETFAESCPFLTRQLVQRASVEDQGPLVTEMAGAQLKALVPDNCVLPDLIGSVRLTQRAWAAGIVRHFTAAVLSQHARDLNNNVAGPPDPCWLHDLVLRQLLSSASRYIPSLPETSCSCQKQEDR